MLLKTKHSTSERQQFCANMSANSISQLNLFRCIEIMRFYKLGTNIAVQPTIKQSAFVLRVLINLNCCCSFSEPEFLTLGCCLLFWWKKCHIIVPVKMSPRSLTKELVHCRGVTHLSRCPTCFSAGQTLTHPLAQKRECGKVEETRGIIET